jgi:ABC-type uncharacterized transport system substrate-binding protein
MRILFILTLFIISLQADKLLILNSNAQIEKYKSVQKAFIENYKGDFKTLDLSKVSKKQIKEYLYDEYPDTVYAIGTKAYSYANTFIPEKTIFFSSIVNYKRFDIEQNRYGVSNELHSGMHLTIIKSLFSNIGSLGIIYSEYTKDLFENFKRNASSIGLKIKGQKISKNSSIDKEVLDQTDALLMIADPILLKNKNNVIEIFKQMKILKKPIFAYHELFIKFGASLVISAHNPTIGAQVASMIKQFEAKKDFPKIQIPMGTNVIFNKKTADALGLEYNEQALSVVNKVIE